MSDCGAPIRNACAASSANDSRDSKPTNLGESDFKDIKNITSTVFASCRNPALIKQRTSLFFQTVNHAKVIWDPKLKPKGLFGGHLNVRSAVAKTDQVKHLLMNSNLDYLCLSETWLQTSTPVSVYSIPGYQCFRRDRVGGRGGGVLIYVRDGFKCERITLDAAGTLEHVAIKIVLSHQMSFLLIAFYRPPNSKRLLL